LVLTIGTTRSLSAAIIGTNPPALPLTAERIATLNTAQQSGWRKYLEHSDRQLRADQAFFFHEMKQHSVKQTLMPPQGRRLSLRERAGWYGQTEGQRIADIVLSFQTPAGGWSKNLDMTQHRRSPGEQFSHDNVSSLIANSDNDVPRAKNWNYVGTFDNDATITQLRYLAKRSWINNFRG